jgi:hypothetical protein
MKGICPRVSHTTTPVQASQNSYTHLCHTKLRHQTYLHHLSRYVTDIHTSCAACRQPSSMRLLKRLNCVLFRTNYLAERRARRVDFLRARESCRRTCASRQTPWRRTAIIAVTKYTFLVEELLNFELTVCQVRTIGR